MSVRGRTVLAVVALDLADLHHLDQVRANFETDENMEGTVCDSWNYSWDKLKVSGVSAGTRVWFVGVSGAEMNVAES